MHALGGQGQGHSHGSEETLGHVGDNDTDGEDEHIDDGVLDNKETVEEEGDTEDNGNDGDEDNKSLNLMRKGSLLVLSRVGQVCNSADGGLVTSAEDNTLTATIGAGRAEEGNVGRLIDAIRALRRVAKKLLGFTGERRVVDLHLVRLEQDGISGDLEAAPNLNNVSRDEISCFDITPILAVAPD